MSNIDKQAVQAVADLKAGYTLGHADVAILNELARIALASLEAGPVAWAHRLINKRNGVVHPWVYGSAETSPSEGDIFNIEVMPLYTAPPAPVSVPDAMEMDDDFDSAFEHGKAVGWNACRAAMLQGSESRPELTVWYGSMPETNGKTNWTAMLHRKGQHPWDGITIECSEYPDRVRYEADRMRHLIGELSEEPDILEYDSEAHSGYVKPGNSPVIPDGWVACSERMPDDDDFVYIWPRPDFGVELHVGQYCECHPKGDGWYAQVYEQNYGIEWCPITVTHWMPLPAAPQQEVTQALAKGMERYGDAMQKLADSGD